MMNGTPAIDTVHPTGLVQDCLTCKSPNWKGVSSREDAGQATKVIYSYIRPDGHPVSMAGVLLSPIYKPMNCKQDFESIV